MSENQNPEQKARDTIDALLKQAGWVVQSSKKIDLNIGLGQDKSLADLGNLPEPDELALEIIDNLEAGLNSFREIAAGL
jgi:hypothetical protein